MYDRTCTYSIAKDTLCRERLSYTKYIDNRLKYL